MKKFSAVLILVTILVSLFSVPAMANKTQHLTGEFTDIEDHWAYKQMSELIAMGILKGYTKSVWNQGLGKMTTVQLVKPYQKITRAEFATLLYQALNLQPESQAAPVTDEIPYWATEAVSTLYKNGIITGNPDGSFRPYNNISRAEIVTMLVKALNNKSQLTGKKFPDVPSWHWAYTNIQIASALGIVNGLPNGKFAPVRGAERAEVLVMLYQFLCKDNTQAPDDDIILSRTKKVLRTMERGINGNDPVDLTSVSDSFTGEQEVIVTDSEKVLNDLKQNGSVDYQVTYPGVVVWKSDRLAEVVYETFATFKTKDTNLEQHSKEHYFLMKTGDQWYIYSNTDERML